MKNFEDPLFIDFLVQINFHRYLEYYILCHNIISEDVGSEEKVNFIKEIVRYLQLSQKGHNLAMRSQRNRYNLLIHCQNLKSISDLNMELFKDSFDYVYTKLIEKYFYFDRKIKRR